MAARTYINMLLTSHFKSSAFVSILNALSELMPAQSCPSIFNIWSPNRIPTSVAGESTETKQQNIPASIDFSFNPNFLDWSRQIVTIRTPFNGLSTIFFTTKNTWYRSPGDPGFKECFISNLFNFRAHNTSICPTSNGRQSATSFVWNRNSRLILCNHLPIAK